MKRTTTLLTNAALLAALVPACTTAQTGDQIQEVSGGSLIKMGMTSRVAVLLDDIPAGPAREAAAADAIAKSSDFWTTRAKAQVKLTYYRLVFRGLYYSSNWASDPKVRGPLPLPPQQVWNVALTGTPHRETDPQHDMIVADYSFGAYILSDGDSPAKVEPALANIGGVWDEPFNLPSDPELLLERTGYACMDEDEYPAGSVFEENTWYFYDDNCKVNGSSGCHITVRPSESCVESLQKHTGIIKTAMHFQRVAYDPTIANQVRVGTIVNPNGADLSVVQPAMEDEQRVVYKYFAPGSCELDEGVISKLGWRRLLMFSAVVQNNGTDRIHIGDLRDPNNPWFAAHVFEFSACHNHYHFSHYGNFGYNGAPGSKRAFCLEDTNRFHNDEYTPLTAEHQSCWFQGIGHGWGDEYEFGIPGQWVDITDVDASTPHALTFDNNPDKFLCEGEPMLDATGNPIFDPTSFVSKSGDVVSRMRCDAPATWHDNNVGSTMVSANPGDSFVTQDCKRGQIGPNRDCGFTADPALRACALGTTVTLSCTNTGPAQVLRTCEKSSALGSGVACTLRDAAANTIVNGPTTVTFTCPGVRDAASPTGGYSLYSATLAPSQGAGGVTCTAM